MPVMETLRSVCRGVVQKKKYDIDEQDTDNLNRCLTRWDLTALGVGSTIGVGIYVLAGHVAKSIAGPSIVLSFCLAAVVSMLSGLCYAELGTRLPKAGSAYTYTYVSIGEFAAFLVGWSLILGYVLGTASVAKGMSLYIDSLLNNVLVDFFKTHLPLNLPVLADYVDLLAFCIVTAVGVALAFGVKESMRLNSIFSLINVLTVLFVIVVGATKADLNNWSIPASAVPDARFGSGGFFPYGFSGVLEGASYCFFGFVGFDAISSTAEEAINPRKSIPLTISLSLAIIFVGYFGLSAVLTLMVPYYAQDEGAPITHAFSYVGMNWAYWVVSVGALCGLGSSVFGALFPLPRIIYAMANDGVLFKKMASVSMGRKSPILATLSVTLPIALLASFLDLPSLIRMMSIGTLIAYGMVGCCLVFLRYFYDVLQDFEESVTRCDNSVGAILRQIIGRDAAAPNALTKTIVVSCMWLFVLASASAIIIYKETRTIGVPFIVLHVLLVIFVVIIGLQPKNVKHEGFMVPLVPVIPLLALYSNLFLLLMMEWAVWYKYLFWFFLGWPLYFACLYSRIKDQQELETDKSTNNLPDPGISTNFTKKTTDKQDLKEISFQTSEESMNYNKINRIVSIKPSTHKNGMIEEHKQLENKSNQKTLPSDDTTPNDSAPKKSIALKPELKDVSFQTSQESINFNTKNQIVTIESLQNNTQNDETIDEYKQIENVDSDQGSLPHAGINPDNHVKKDPVLLRTDPNDIFSEYSDESMNFNGENKNVTIESLQYSTQKYALIDEHKQFQAAESYQEKQSRIIEFLDQVIKAGEEDLIEAVSEEYVNNEIGTKENRNEDVSRKLESSDNESEMSVTPSPLKYDVVAQIHREDSYRAKESLDQLEDTLQNIQSDDSKTDESGYSDTTDVQNETSLENLAKMQSENHQSVLTDHKKNTIMNSHNENKDPTEKHNSPKTNIPTPPPLDEEFFQSQSFKRSKTLHSKKTFSQEAQNQMRTSISSVNSIDDNNIVFGSVRQQNFMDKLNCIFKNRPPNENKPRRSNSTSNIIDLTQLKVVETDINFNRPSHLSDLHKELLSKTTHSIPRPSIVKKNTKVGENHQEIEDNELSMSREALKSRLESLFANGGPKPQKPRPWSNPQSQHESLEYEQLQEEVKKVLPKKDKMDTLKLQKAKFGEVLDSMKKAISKRDEEF